MSYQVLARKWRPSNFAQMVGQEHVLQALANALDSQRLHHAYLFSGTRGVGKTTIGRIFAKSLNCEQGISSRPCGECSSCNEVDQGRSVDLIEIDAASRTGVDDMRELLDNVQYAPTRSRFKIYLIDEVHMLSKHSFNALLKTLEEPPPHIKFLLATTDPQKLPVTVLSRCLQFNLKRMSRVQILAQLKYLCEQEQVEADEAALVQLASAADGSMRDALSLLDQAIGYGAGAVRQQAVEAMLGSISRDYLERLLDALATQQAATLVNEARQVIEQNPEFQRVCAEMISLLQQVALYQTDPRLALTDEFPEEMLQKYAGSWSAEEVQLYYQILLQGRQDLLICPDEAAGFEMLMLRLVAFSPRTELVEHDHPLKKKPELRAVSPASAHGPANVSATAEVSPASSGTPVKAQTGEPIGELQASEFQASEFQANELQANELQASELQASELQASELQASEPETNELQSNDAAVSAEPEQAPAGQDHDDESAFSIGGAEFNWLTMAYTLGLTGMAQELAANSEFASLTDNTLSLRLPEELYGLVDDVTREEIVRALQQKLGVSLRLQLSAVAVLTGTTPLQAKLERERVERLDAIAAIRDEAMVKKLQQAFAAELDETSVVKIDSNRK